MKKIITILFLALPLVAGAQDKKTWSFYGNVGYGTSSVCTLEGLTLSTEDAQYFKQRGVVPSFQTEGTPSQSFYFDLGASRYFNQFRLSAQSSYQRLAQSNFKANTFSADFLGGYNFLKADNFELNLDLGVGLYGVLSNYTYTWQGMENGEVKETKVCDLGDCNTYSFSVPAKLSLLYNITSHSWLGLYAQGRYCTVSNSFCPTLSASAGIEYRVTLGKSKAKKSTYVDTYIPEIPETKATVTEVKEEVKAEEVKVEPQCPIQYPSTTIYNTGTIIYGNQIVNNYYYSSTAETTPKVGPTIASVYFDSGSSVLTDASISTLDALNMNGAIKVMINGYTDSVSDDRTNIPLSLNRAKAVFEYLRVKYPMVEMTYGGASSSCPVADNVTDAGKAKNRRVEILILY